MSLEMLAAVTLHDHLDATPTTSTERRGPGGAGKDAKIKSRMQKKALNAAFQRDPRPSSATRIALALEIGLSPKEVSVWFQNRRFRIKAAADHVSTTGSSQTCLKKQLSRAHLLRRARPPCQRDAHAHPHFHKVFRYSF